MSTSEQPDFESVKTRLAEIAEAVDDESLSLDDALDLYEEAVALGLQASDLLETGIVVPDETADGEASAEAQTSEPGSPRASGAAAAAAAAQQPDSGGN